MQRVKMLCTVPGSFDGYTVQTFIKGREYDMPDDLVQNLINGGMVELVLDNKAIQTAPEKKKSNVQPKKR